MIKFSDFFQFTFAVFGPQNVIMRIDGAVFYMTVDWITTDMLTIQKNTTGRIRFMHKDELKYVPLYGVYFWVVCI